MKYVAIILGTTLLGTIIGACVFGVGYGVVHWFDPGSGVPFSGREATPTIVLFGSLAGLIPGALTGLLVGLLIVIHKLR